MSGGALLLLLLLAGVLVFWLPMASLGFWPPFSSTTVIRVRSGKLFLPRGQLRGLVRDDVAEVFSSAGITSGFIAITPGSRVHFSRNIPKPVRQRLRNVLLN